MTSEDIRNRRCTEKEKRAARRAAASQAAGDDSGINVDDIPHTVTSSTRGQFRSTALDTGDSFSFTFRDVGTFEYFCSLHPHMTATIKVEGTVGKAGSGADAVH